MLHKLMYEVKFIKLIYSSYLSFLHSLRILYRPRNRLSFTTFLKLCFICDYLYLYIILGHLFPSYLHGP